MCFVSKGTKKREISPPKCNNITAMRNLKGSLLKESFHIAQDTDLSKSDQ